VKQSFRIPSTIFVLGLLLAAFGAGSVLAKQADRGDLGLLDASHAPAALVAPSDDDVAWAGSDGEDISNIKPDSMGVFFINDAGLETTKTGNTRTWIGAGATTGNQDTFNIASGVVTDVSGSAAITVATTTLTAAAYSTSTPATTPLVDGSVTVAANFPLPNLETGVFTLLGGTSVGTTTVTFSHHVRDSYAGSDSSLRRAKVISTSDPQGEWVTIMEVSAIGLNSAVSSEAGTTAADGLSVTVDNVPIVDADSDGDVDAEDVTITVAGTAVASSTISEINVETGVITFGTAQGLATTTAVSYSHATLSPTANVFRGDVLLGSNAALQGTNGDGVWVQDGDTVTVNYVDSNGATVNSDTIVVDGVKPTIANISPEDGKITNVVNPTLTFDVVDTGAGILNTAPDVQVEINGVAVSNPSFQFITDGVRLFFASGTSWITAFNVVDGTKFEVKITATDIAGNSKVLSGTDVEYTIDLGEPEVVSAITGTDWDKNKAEEKTAVTTSVRVTFNEEVDATSVQATDFTVGGAKPSDVIVGTTDGYKDKAYLTVAALAPDTKPEVVVTGEILDLGGNAVETGVDTAKATSNDGLKPTITVTVGQALAVDEDEVKVTVDIDEKLAVGGLVISVNGPTGATNAGTLTTTSPQPQKHEGDFTIAAGTATGDYGVSIRVTDLGGNQTDNLTAVSAEVVAATDIDVTSGTVITVGNGPIADADFDGDVDKDDISSLSFSTNAATSSAITAVDASARTITLSSSVGSTETATVSYSYVGSSTFEVDQTDPTVTFDPVAKTELQDQSPFIRIIFDDNEYPGDAFKTVTLTKAELTKPDDTTEDLLESFKTLDNIEYLWAANDLPLGEYSLKISGTDTAANAGLEDVSSTFKIVERAPFEVALRPGWNLVSLPGLPASTDVNTVITNTDVDTVITYDPAVAGGWSTATRVAGGDLEGTLTTIDGRLGLWVHTTTFEPIEVDIPGISAGASVLPTSFNLLGGWNLVPVATLDIETSADIDVDSYFSGLSWSRAYGFNATSNKFEGILPLDDDNNPVVSVGKGYWIFLKEDGTLVP
jgi:hypothetical protein